MAELHHVSRYNKRLSTYAVERIVKDDVERYAIASAESPPQRIWKPKYAGNIQLFAYVAKVELTDARRGYTNDVILNLSDEESFYARSNNIMTRGWTAHNVAHTAIRQFLDGTLSSDIDAQHFYESLTEAQIQNMNMLAALAQ